MKIKRRIFVLFAFCSLNAFSLTETNFWYSDSNTNNTLELSSNLLNTSATSTAFIDIDITQSDSGEVVNGLNLTFCKGETKTFIPTDPITLTPGAEDIVYRWTFDDGSGSPASEISNTPNLRLSSLSPINSGTYTLLITLIDTLGDPLEYNAAFTINVLDALIPRATKPTDLYSCDKNGTGFVEFNLEEERSSEILNRLDPVSFAVSYHASQQEAIDNTSPFPTLQSLTTQSVYARVYNKNAPDACFDITELKVRVSDEIEIATPTALRICDNDIDSPLDTDGIVNTFILEVKDEEILRSLENPSDFEVTYFENEEDALTGNNASLINKSTNYQVINNKDVYVRVQNILYTSCVIKTVRTLKLVVNTLPTVNDEVLLEQCHTNLDLDTKVNLTLAQISIADPLSADFRIYRFHYFAEEQHAIDGTPRVDPTNYPLTINGEAWVRTYSNNQLKCFSISKINIIVGFTAEQEPLVNLIEECDDFLDKAGNDTDQNSYTDGITNFDLSIVTDNNYEKIYTTHGLTNPEEFYITFFETEERRARSLNELTTIPNYRNKNNPRVNGEVFSLYYKILRLDNNRCEGLGKIGLRVKPTPIANDIPPIIACDNTLIGAIDDGKINFDLTDFVNDIYLGTTQTVPDFEISFHTSEDRDSSDLISNPNDFTNDVPAGFIPGDVVTQTIYVKVVNTVNLCENIFSSFTIRVNPLPTTIGSTPPIEICDTDRDYTRDDIKLGDRDANVLGGRDASTHIVNYHKTAADALLNISGLTILSKIAYENDLAATTLPIDLNSDDPATNIVYISIYNTETSCASATIDFLDIYIYPALNLPTSLSPLEECDNALDMDADYTNGISGGIILNTKIDDILFNYTPPEPANYSITFYNDIADINDITKALDATNYENTINNETIYVRVENISSPCINTSLSFTINILPIPIANTISPEECDDTFIDALDDGKINFNLTSYVNEILGPTQTTPDFEVSFHTTTDRDNSDLISNPNSFTNDAPVGFVPGDIVTQTIYIKVTNTIFSECANALNFFDLTVNPLPIAIGSIPTLDICDTDRNYLSDEIKLGDRDEAILDGRDAALYSVNYHISKENALLNINDPAKLSKTAYGNLLANTTLPSDLDSDNPAFEDVYISIYNQVTTCASSKIDSLRINIYPIFNLPASLSPIEACDNKLDSAEDDTNGINGNIVLNEKVDEILANYATPEPANYTITFYNNIADINDISKALNDTNYENTVNNETIYVRIEHISNPCVNTNLSFTINIKPLPSFTVEGEEFEADPLSICTSDSFPSIILMAENPGATNYNYQWTDQGGNFLGDTSIYNATAPGKYTITAFDQLPDTCSRSRTIVVEESKLADISEEDVTIIDDANNIGGEKTLSIFITTVNQNLGIGDYEFAILNIDTGVRTPSIGYQDSPLFENLNGGIYTIIVNDKKSCGFVSLDVPVIQFPKFFTPNADGTNDTWLVKGGSRGFYPNSNINLFDRFGKLIAKLPLDSNGWDGTYNGKLMPSGNYYFNITLIPKNTGNTPKPNINKTGNFSLLRK